MNLDMLKVQNFKIGTFRCSQKQLELETQRFDYLKEKISVLNKNINILKSNFSKYKNAQEILAKQYTLLRSIEDELYKDVLQVGKTKALGYLPEPYLCASGRNLDYFIEYAISRNLSFHISEKGFTSRVLAIYDKRWVENLLNSNKDILYKNNLPLDADSFVKFVMDGKRVHYEDNMELFLLIAIAFNDSRLERIA